MTTQIILFEIYHLKLLFKNKIRIFKQKFVKLKRLEMF